MALVIILITQTIIQTTDLTIPTIDLTTLTQILFTMTKIEVARGFGEVKGDSRLLLQENLFRLEM